MSTPRPLPSRAEGIEPWRTYHDLLARMGRAQDALVEFLGLDVLEPQPSVGTVRCPDKGAHDRHWYVVRADGITYAQGCCNGEEIGSGELLDSTSEVQED